MLEDLTKPQFVREEFQDLLQYLMIAGYSLFFTFKEIVCNLIIIKN